MDRFIGYKQKYDSLCRTDLKSNMDRFIDFGEYANPSFESHLKSNMDRFIADFFANFFIVVSI